MTRYRNAPSMGLRPADTVLPRSKADPGEYGFEPGCSQYRQNVRHLSGPRV